MNSRTVIEAVSADKFLPVHYSVDRDGRMVRRALSRKPDLDGFYGEPVELDYRTAAQYVSAYEGTADDFETGVVYVWNAQKGWWDEKDAAPETQED